MVRKRSAQRPARKGLRTTRRRELERPAAGARTGRSPATRGLFTSHLAPDEAAAVLRDLLDGHRDLRPEAERIARELLANVRADEVAARVERAVLGVDPDRLAERSGRKRWGYVEPGEAAYGLLEEVLAPFLSDMKRLVALGLEQSAVATCAGIVLGLYSVHGDNGDGVLVYASEFPAETAGHAAATLARESARTHRRRWTLPESFIDGVPDWKAMLLRAGRGR